MYLDYYKLSLAPFSVSPDPRFFWIGPERREACASLQEAILQGRGFVLLAGEPGTGKSTTLNAVIARLEGNIRFAKIIDPALSEMDFFNSIANALEMGRTFQDKEEFLFELEYLLNQPDSKRIVFFIDEAQRLAPALLEQIDGFFKAATLGAGLCCTVAGQPEFLDAFSQNRALSRRIVYRHIIEPFTLSETQAYIAHRLEVAGRREPIFTPAAVQEIFSLSKGNPRLINVVCERALLEGCAMHKPEIGPGLVGKNMQDKTLRPTTSTEPESSFQAAEPTAAPIQVGARAGTVNGSFAKKLFGTHTGRLVVYLSTIAVLFVSGVWIFFSKKGGFRIDDLFPPKNSAPATKSVQLSEPAVGAEDVRRFQEQIIELRRDRDQAVDRLNALQAEFDKLEIELHKLRAANERAKGLERAIVWKDAAISELRSRLESSAYAGADPTDDLKREIETLKKVNSRLQERLDELNR